MVKKEMKTHPRPFKKVNNRKKKKEKGKGKKKGRNSKINGSMSKPRPTMNILMPIKRERNCELSRGQ